MEYTSVSNLSYSASDNSTINCTVNFTGLGSVEFTACASDSEAHGREIYSKAVNGDFGTVTAYSG